MFKVLFLMILIPCFSLADNLKIAIIDTGVNIDHREFKSFLDHHPKDGLQAFDFITDKRKTIDNHGHGTNIASLIALNNKTKFKIIPLRFTDGSDKTETMIRDMQNFNKALDMAIGLDVNIINISYTHGMFRHSEYELFKKAKDKKILVIVAAGNNNQDLNTENEFDKTYPCMYDLENVICVGNWDSDKKQKADNSNYNGRVFNYVDGNLKIGLGKTNASPEESLNIMSGSSQSAALLSRWILDQKTNGKKYEDILKILKNQKIIEVGEKK
jgi:subtilisin family serine protease